MNLQHALAQISSDPDATLVFAGGTDLMVQLHAGLWPQKRILDISHLAELKGIEVSADSISIGALTTYSQIRQHQQLCAEFPMLAQAAHMTGAWAIQNRGTIGGNLANASPAADTPPALLAYDARLVLLSQRGERELDYSSFHLGYKTTALAKDELIAKVILPRRKGVHFSFYEKVGARAAQAIAKVGIALSARRAGSALCDLRIAFSSVAPTPLRCEKTERELEDQSLSQELISHALATLDAEIAPIDDIRSDARYRRCVAGNLLKHALAEASSCKFSS